MLYDKKIIRACMDEAIIPYSGKLWRALNLANRSTDDIGEF